MENQISNIQIVPIKPHDGLLAFVSFVLNDAFYMSGIGICSRPNGSYRLIYPTKKYSHNNANIFHPINKIIAEQIEQAVIEKFEEVINLY